MSPELIVGVGLLGGLGAIARFLVDSAVTSRVARELPIGTFVVNVTGALLLGLLVGSALSSDALRLAGTGLIGSYTTFSTWVFESHRLAEEGETRPSALNLVGSLVAGLFVAWVGREIGMGL